MANLYDIMKGKAYNVLAVIASCDHTKAKAKGYDDGWAMLIDRHDDNEMALFCTNLHTALDGDQAKILLDGLAQQYAKQPDWPTFVNAATDYPEWKPSRETLDEHKARIAA